MSTHRIRRVLVLIGVIVSIAVAYGQMALNLGLQPDQFASQGDTTLRAASYAFSIWGVIYLGLAIYAVYQFLPKTPETPMLRLFGWCSIAAFAGISGWVIAAAADAKWTTVILIAASAAVLIAPLISSRPWMRTAGRTQRMLVVWPLALLAGWLTIAAPLNLLTVLTAKFLLGGVPPFIWAVGGIVLTGLVTLTVAAVSRVWIYVAPVIWGLVGVFSAEREDGDMALALAALAVAFLIAMGVAVVMARKPALKVEAEPSEPEPAPVMQPPV